MNLLPAGFGLSRPSPPALDVAPDHDWVGWRVGAFALDVLEPAAGSVLTSTALWDAYKQWCGEAKKVPLALPVFLSRFEEIAADAGIPRKQKGGHVAFHDTAVKKRRAQS